MQSQGKRCLAAGVFSFALIFPAVAPAATYKIIYSMTGLGAAGGNMPMSGVVIGPKKQLYGTTKFGGTASAKCKTGCGVVYRLTPPAAGKTAWIYKVLHAFSGPAAGLFPIGRPVVTSGEIIYGTAFSGGDKNGGVVYKLTPNAAHTSWTKTIIYKFPSASAFPNGQGPVGDLLLDSLGRLVVTTTMGGSAGDGMLLKLIPPTSGTAWTPNILHPFNQAFSGGTPYAGAVELSPKYYFGIATKGKNSNCGSVWADGPLNGNPANSTAYSDVVPFCTNVSLFDGNFTPGPGFGSLLVLNSKIYGTTVGGHNMGAGTGTGGKGIVFKVDPPSCIGFGCSGASVTLLHSFSGAEGFYPNGGLVADSGGTKLYGTNAKGGVHSKGTLWRMTNAGGSTAVLRSFVGAPNDGSAPYGGLAISATGTIYGTTSTGGKKNFGAVFSYQP